MTRFGSCFLGLQLTYNPIYSESPSMQQKEAAPMSNQGQSQTPHPKQEWVWDYPRPPRVEPTSRRIRVIFNGETIADTRRAMRVLATSHPPVYYIPPADIRMDLLTPTQRHTLCEFKGVATYWTISIADRTAEN